MLKKPKNTHVKYETNSAAKRKAIWLQKLDFYLQIIAKWSLEKQQTGGCFIVTNNRVLL